MKRYALAPDANPGTAWWPGPIFDFDREVGFRTGVDLVEINQERQRHCINPLVAARSKAPPDRRKKEVGRVGGEEEKPRPQYPTGQNLSVVERKAGYAHKPLGKNGNAI